MSKWIARLKSFLNTDEEWHSFVIGFGDGISFQRTNLLIVEDITGEVHYYKFGVLLGRLGIIGFITRMVEILI